MIDSHELESMGLSDQEFARKLAIYDRKGDLTRRLNRIWELAGTEVIEHAEAFSAVL